MKFVIVEIDLFEAVDQRAKLVINEFVKYQVCICDGSCTYSVGLSHKNYSLFIGVN